MKYCTACKAKYDDSVSFCSIDGEVLEADPERKRISLTLRLDDEPSPSGGRAAGAGVRSEGGRSGGAGGRPEAGRQERGSQDRGRQETGRNAGGRPEANRQDRGKTQQPSTGRPSVPKSAPKPAPVNTAMAEALRKAGLGK